LQSRRHSRDYVTFQTVGGLDSIFFVEFRISSCYAFLGSVALLGHPGNGMALASETILITFLVRSKLWFKRLLTNLRQAIGTMIRKLSFFLVAVDWSVVKSQSAGLRLLPIEELVVKTLLSFCLAPSLVSFRELVLIQLGQIGGGRLLDVDK